MDDRYSTSDHIMFLPQDFKMKILYKIHQLNEASNVVCLSFKSFKEMDTPQQWHVHSGNVQRVHGSRWC